MIGWIVVPLAPLFGLGAEWMARKEFFAATRRQETIELEVEVA